MTKKNPFQRHMISCPVWVWLALVGTTGLLMGSLPARGDESSEPTLIATLQSSAASNEKALACKRLAVEGTAAAVPALAELLDHPELSSWARIALEAIPEAVAGQALVAASDRLQGRLLVGVVNSIGVRGDRQAGDRLTQLLGHDDPAVAAAATVALGRVAGPAAHAALQTALSHAQPAVRSAAAEACVVCAEQCAAQDNAALAVELCRAVRSADVPRIRWLEAMRGEILAQPAAGVPLLLELLRAEDRQAYGMGLSVARELPQPEVTAALLAECERASVERQPRLLLVLADRQDATILPFVVGMATEGTGPTREAALECLGQIGDVTCVEPLLNIAAREPGPVSQLALDALQSLPGEEIDDEIARRLESAAGDERSAVIELAGRRRIRQTAPQLEQAARDADRRIRHAAWLALGEAAGPDSLPLLIECLVNPPAEEETPVAARALQAACLRMPDAEACAKQLAAALPRASVSARQALAEILGTMGGSTALNTLAAAARDPHPDVRDTVSRVLGESMSVDAAPVLLDLARNAPEERFRVRALRGYLRLARQFEMPTPQRVSMCREAWDAATRDAERELVLEVLARYPHLDGLTLAVEAATTPGLTERATQAARAIARELGESTAGVAPLLERLPGSAEN